MSGSLSVFTTEKNGKAYIQFDFVGDLNEAKAMEGILLWGQLLEKQPAQKFEIVFNCIRMTGFETGARVKWQEAMKKFKPAMGNVWVVSENMFIRATAKTMGLLVGYNVKVCRHLTEID